MHSLLDLYPIFILEFKSYTQLAFLELSLWTRTELQNASRGSPYDCYLMNIQSYERPLLIIHFQSYDSHTCPLWSHDYILGTWQPVHL